MLRKSEIAYRSVRYERQKEGKPVTWLLTAQCQRAQQLASVLTHLFQKWFWFDFYLRCDEQETSIRRLEELLDLGRKRLERIPETKQTLPQIEELHAVFLSLDILMAWCIPFDRQDYVGISTFRYSYEEIRDKMIFLAAQYNLRFKEGEIE